MEDKSQKILLTASDGLLTFLQYSCQHDLVEATKALLEAGADVNYVHNNSTRPVLLACKNGNPEILSLLLQYNPDLSPDQHKDTALHIITKQVTESPKYQDCLDILLKAIRSGKTNLNINAGDVKGNTALHYACKYGDDKSVLSLLKNGAYIGVLNAFGVSPLAYMSYSVLQQHLDSCIDSSDRIPREDYSLSINYQFLKPISSGVSDPDYVPLTKDVESIPENVENKEITFETDPLLCIGKTKDLRNLLTHPVLASFIFLKWQRIRSFFYINLSFYILFCFFLTVFILFGYREPNNYQSIPANAIVTESEKVLHEKINVTTIEKQNDFIESNVVGIEIIRVILIILTTILLVRESFQLSVNIKKYLCNFENWLEIILLTVTLSIILCGCNRINGNVRLCPQLCAVAILVSWLELVLLIGKHPLLSNNIEMFKTVSVNFLKFLAWYAILIIAFALSFFTLFRGCSDDDCANENPFLNPGSSLFKTLIMITGEFEAGDIPFLSFIGTSHLIFVLFVFLIAIVLFNLLNGLAVSDTQAIRDDALLYSYISRVKLISYIETMLLGDPIPFRTLYSKIKKLCCCASQSDDSHDHVIVFDYFAEQIVFFPHLIKDDHIFVYPNERNRIGFTEGDIPKSNPKKQTCLSELSYYYLDSFTVKSMEEILERRRKDDTEERSEIEVLKQEIKLCAIRLSKMQEKFETLEHSNKQNEKLLIQILAILSFNNTNNER